MKFRLGTAQDIQALKALAYKSWSRFKPELTEENWKKLAGSLTDDKLYAELLQHSTSIICETQRKEIIGMIFLVPSGNPTELFLAEWCYIRFLTVDADFSGQGIGRQLIKRCIEIAEDNNEKTIALHTSEMMNAARHLYESFGFPT